VVCRPDKIWSKGVSRKLSSIVQGQASIACNMSFNDHFPGEGSCTLEPKRIMLNINTVSFRAAFVLWVKFICSVAVLLLLQISMSLQWPYRRRCPAARTCLDPTRLPNRRS
jgi:hypothetical protein